MATEFRTFNDVTRPRKEPSGGQLTDGFYFDTWRGRSRSKDVTSCARRKSASRLQSDQHQLNNSAACDGETLGDGDGKIVEMEVMEAAEEEDANHNTRVCPDSDSSSSDAGESDGSTGPALLLFPGSTGSKFLLNMMTADDYHTVYWPKLEQALELLLTHSPMEHVSISYEQIYSQVYKCVCQQHSELLYRDLIQKVRTHLERVSAELQLSPVDHLIEHFNTVLTRYITALHCIVPLFIYMNKFYIESKLKRDLRDDLMKLFALHVAERHLATLLPLLEAAQAQPFSVRPSTMASVVKGLHALRPDWVSLAPALFSAFIPRIDPPALESQLPFYAAQDRKLQAELSQSGFSRGDQSRKRASEES